MVWKKGQSGNLKGRPPIGTSMAERLRTEDTEACLKKLRELRDSGPEIVQYQVARYLFERAWGKIPEIVETREVITLDQLDLDMLAADEIKQLQQLLDKALQTTKAFEKSEKAAKDG